MLACFLRHRCAVPVPITVTTPSIFLRQISSSQWFRASSSGGKSSSGSSSEDSSTATDSESTLKSILSFLSRADAVVEKEQAAAAAAADASDSSDGGYTHPEAASSIPQPGKSRKRDSDQFRGPRYKSRVIPWALYNYLEPMKLTSLPSVSEPSDELDKASFANLMRNSSFVQLGDPSGKELVGYVMEVVKDDLYIDFGGKFHCMCRRPPVNGQQYVRGALVRVRLVDPEMNSRFMSSERSITLMEADAQLLGLYKPIPLSSTQKEDEEVEVVEAMDEVLVNPR